MSDASVDVLARRFAVDGARWQDGPGGLPFLIVDGGACRARLTPYGAHLCEWTPPGQSRSVVFLSPRSRFTAGTAIRGGVPVCFPWFAGHRSDAAKPAHGFARTRAWDVARIAREDEAVAAELVLSADSDTRRHWAADFEARLSLRLGASLEMTLTVLNRGANAIAYEAALHSYFAVGDVETIAIRGLGGARFVDKVDRLAEKVQGSGPVSVRGEIDRVFLETSATCEVEDPVFRRRVRIEKSGSLATVVWNPGPVKGPAIADLGNDLWRHFVCVETANCGIHEVRLAPGGRHAMSARVSVV